MLQGVLAVILAYALGCLCFGYYLTRLLTGQDIRDLGSGNAGSRNVGRIAGKKGFALTFVGDAGKGVLAVMLARYLSGVESVSYMALLAVVAGHIWPVQLGFKGGKGMATMAGGLAVLNPLLFVAALFTCGVMLLFVRSATKAGIIATALLPVILLSLQLRGGNLSIAGLLVVCAMAGVVLYAHRTNIGQEFFGKPAVAVSRENDL